MYRGGALNDAARSVRRFQATDSSCWNTAGSDKQEMAEARIDESPSTDAA